MIVSLPWMRLVLVGASVAYLLYLAVKIAFAGTKIAFIPAHTPPGVWGGIALQAINPKAYAVNTSLMTGFGFAPNNLAFELVAKILIINAIWIPLHLAWLWAGVALHRLDLPQHNQRIINIFMALAMLGVVGLTVWSSFEISK